MDSQKFIIGQIPLSGSKILLQFLRWNIRKQKQFSKINNIPISMKKKSFSNIQNDTTCHNSMGRPSGLSTVSKKEPVMNIFPRQLMGSPSQLIQFTQNLNICSICYQGQNQIEKIIRKPCKCQHLVHKKCLQKIVQNSFKKTQKQQARYKCQMCKQYLQAEIKNSYNLNHGKLCSFKGSILYHYIGCIFIFLGQIGLFVFYLNWCLKNQLQQKSYNNKVSDDNSFPESKIDTKNNIQQDNFMSMKEVQTITVLIIIFLGIIFLILIINLLKNHLILVNKKIILLSKKETSKLSSIPTHDTSVLKKNLKAEKLQN